MSTVGFYPINIAIQFSQDEFISCLFTDVPHQERFYRIVETSYKQQDGILLIYDISDKKSFKIINDYYCPTIKKLCDENIKVLLLGNKIDRNEIRKVSHEEGVKLAQKHNFKFMECSCLKNENVFEAFMELIEMIYIPSKKYKDKLSSKNIEKNNITQKEKKTKKLISVDINSKVDKNSKHYLDENISKEKYNNIEIIGEGGYGKIYKAKINNNEYIAIKEIDIDKIRQQCEDNFMNDVEENISKFKNYISNEIKNMIICSEENTNINSVKFYDYFYNDKKVMIIMELCDDNLKNVLKKRESFSIKEIHEIILQLNYTLKIMVDNKIIHRDLKLENILVKYKDKEKTKYNIKLADYGVSRQIDNFKTKTMTKIGTSYTMAPEILKGEKYDNKCDLWSIGIIIYQLFFKKTPFQGMTDLALLNNIKNNKIIKKTNNKELDDLLSKLLKEEPKKRMTWEEYFQHPFCKSTDEEDKIRDKNEENIIEEEGYSKTKCFAF